MKIMNRLKNGLMKASSIVMQRWFLLKAYLKSLRRMKKEEISKAEKLLIPEDIQFYYRIKLLGKPFSCFKDNKMKTGYFYEGKKYYDK